jgi:AraC family transcriptional regulator of adaptative response/methylated-DNA-[protein]-cysteine methyltransferase
MNAYPHIADAIRVLDGHRAPMPDPAALAARIGLSPSRFHGMLESWGHAAPEEVLRCLTLAGIRDRLHNGHGVPAAPCPDRGDPRVVVVAGTPDERQSRGAGLTLHAGVAASPFGHCLIAETARGICQLTFFDEGGRDHALAGLQAGWPFAKVIRDDGRAAGLASRIFAPVPAAAARWTVHVQGTPFQLGVWRALVRVPVGAVVSYAALAAAAGKPTACRATGTAVGANPVAFLIPCHRVIPASGGTGQYRGGVVRKRAMLAWESATTRAGR